MESDPRIERPVDETPTQRRQPDQKDPTRGSLASRTWLGLASFAVLLLLLVVFLAQNTDQVPLNLFGWTWHPPLAVALLAAAAAGLLLAVLAGSVRIWQLRRRVRRDSAR